MEAAVRRLPWGEAVTETAPGMKPDTLRRTFLRWTRKGLWKEMLRLMRFAGAPSGAMEWFVCMAYRRAWRAQGIGGVVLARRMGFASALRAPPEWMRDPILSGDCLKRAAKWFPKGCGAVAGVLDVAVRLLRDTLRMARGPSRVPRAAVAGW